MIPEDHLLKRLNKFVSFDFVKDKTKSYYSHTGKPSIDPVVLVKMLIIGYLFDIRSERKLVEEISLNLAYRWYIGYDWMRLFLIIQYFQKQELGLVKNFSVRFLRKY